MRILLLTSLLLTVLAASAGEEKWQWWNELHGWKPGMPGWRNWMIISPAYLGPNALPVPEVKNGLIPSETEIDLTVSNHFLRGDITQDLSGRLLVPFAKGKVAVEMYGVAFERFAFSEEIRNKRFARDQDGKGTMSGDFYFSTLVQLIKGRQFPNTLLRMAVKTASGYQEAARYTDTPGYFFDVSFSKTWETPSGMWRPFGMIGFYSWQSYDEDVPQNDATLYALGIETRQKRWLLSSSLSGYSGYKNIGDRPVQLNFSLRRESPRHAFRLQYLHGLRDWQYKTLKISYILKFHGVN